MGFLSDFFSNPIQGTWDALTSIPGSPEAAAQGVYGGLNGDLSWNPYSQDNSVWDTGAGGTYLSQDPNNRKWGRTIGTAIGAAFGAPALAGAAGAAGGGAGAATTPALIDSAAGTAGYGASSATPSLLASIGSAAGRGAATNGGLTALSGGDGKDILRSAAIGGLSGGAGAYTGGQFTGDESLYANGAVRGVTGAALSGGSGKDILKSGVTGSLSSGFSPNYAGYLGVDDPNISGAINGGINGGISSKINGGNVGQSTLLSTLPGLFKYGMSQSTPASNPNNDIYVDTANQQSLAPWATQATDLFGNPSPEMSTQKHALASGTDSFNTEGFNVPQQQQVSSGSFSDQLGSILGGVGINKNNFGSVLGSGLGIWDAIRRRNQLKQLQTQMGANRGAYETQLRSNLLRRDAASGRRSDYAGRETQLQAALAQLDAHNAPGLMNLTNANMQNTTNGLRSLWNLGDRTHWFGYGG